MDLLTEHSATHFSDTPEHSSTMVVEKSPAEVKELTERGTVKVVDIRNPAAFKAGHIPGAINIPLPRLPREVDRHEWDVDVVVVCPIGQSSLQAARLIESYEEVGQDRTVASMAGGYEAWDYELETSADD